MINDDDDDDNTPVTRGELRQLARKLLSRVWVEWTYETPDSQLATNKMCEGFAADIYAVVGEGDASKDEDEL